MRKQYRIKDHQRAESKNCGFPKFEEHYWRRQRYDIIKESSGMMMGEGEYRIITAIPARSNVFYEQEVDTKVPYRKYGASSC